MNFSHRISAGALVVHNHRVLLVHQQLPNHDAFWVPPGGGVEGNETLMDCAVRECFEESGLRVRPRQIVYIEELFDEGKRVCKHWVHCELIDREPSLNHNNAYADEGIIDAKFLTRDEVAPLNVFPRLMRDQFWTDLAAGFPIFRYLGFSD